MMKEYIRRSMWNSFNVLIDRGQNTHREICECSALFLCYRKAKIKVLRDLFLSLRSHTVMKK